MTNTRVSREILFYYRDGCHLCEEMAAVLQLRWPDLFSQLEWRDVDADPTWQADYGELIPALVVDRELVCFHVVEPERIKACFGNTPNPV